MAKWSPVEPRIYRTFTSMNDRVALMLTLRVNNQQWEWELDADIGHDDIFLAKGSLDIQLTSKQAQEQAIHAAIQRIVNAFTESHNHDSLDR